MFTKKMFLIPFLVLFSLSLYAKTINILYFNDFHGNVNPTKKTPGMVKFVTFIDNFKKNNPNTIVFSGGDNYQGSMMSNTTEGAVVNKMFKMIGLKASAIGNHEFDWGVQKFPAWEKQGGFSYLAANLLNKKTGKQVSWLKPYKIFDIDNYKIGVIGLATTDTVNTTLKDNIKNLIFEDPETALDKTLNQISKLPEGQKPNIVIALTHIPASVDQSNKITGDKELTELEKSASKIKIILSAHNHQIVDAEQKQDLVVEAGSKGQEIANIAITVNDETEKIEDINVKMFDILKYSPEKLNTEAEKTYIFYKEKLSKLSEKVLGYSTADISNEAEKYHLTPMGSTLCKILTDVYGTQVAMLNQWGIRNNLSKGKITWGDLYSVFPFDNTAVVFKLSGKDLKGQIEHSITLQGGAYYGVKATYNPSEPAGSRLSNVTLMDGTPVKDNDFYSVIVNNFMYSGGDHYSYANAKDVNQTYEVLREVIKKYIIKTKKISPVSTDYLTVK